MTELSHIKIMIVNSGHPEMAAEIIEYVKQLAKERNDTEVRNVQLLQRINQLAAELAESRADAERLAKEHCSDDYSPYRSCVHCGGSDYDWTPGSAFGARTDEIVHKPNCPITLHRALVERENGK